MPRRRSGGTGRSGRGCYGRTTADARLHWGSPVDPALRSVIMAVGVQGRAAPELGPMLLERHGAVLRAFGGRLNTLRVSPNLMTEDESLDRILDVLASQGA